MYISNYELETLFCDDFSAGISELMIITFMCIPITFLMTICGGIIVMRTKIRVPVYDEKEEEKKIVDK